VVDGVCMLEMFRVAIDLWQQYYGKYSVRMHICILGRSYQPVSAGILPSVARTIR
jgi:hypothetical protein